MRVSPKMDDNAINAICRITNNAPGPSLIQHGHVMLSRGFTAGSLWTFIEIQESRGRTPPRVQLSGASAEHGSQGHRSLTRTQSQPVVLEAHFLQPLWTRGLKGEEEEGVIIV